MDRTIIIFLLGVVLWSLQKIKKMQKRLDTEFQKLNALHAIEQYKAEVEELYQEVRIYRHFFRNHLNVLQNYLPNEPQKAEEYLWLITKTVRSMDRVVYTGNLELDAFLHLKSEELRQSGLSVVLETGQLGEVQMNVYDLISIAGYMTEVAAVAGSLFAKKEISIRIFRYKDMLNCSVDFHRELIQSEPFMTFFRATKGEMKRLIKKHHGTQYEQLKGDMYQYKIIV